MPAIATTGQIIFELDRFELVDEDRLEVSGRWYGVRGRRFVRPTLTLQVGSKRVRKLANLEHKPWAAEDGGQWQASFPCPNDNVTEAQLAVAPDIAVLLPAPGSNGPSPRRLEAAPPRRRRRQPIPPEDPTPTPEPVKARKGKPAAAAPGSAAAPAAAAPPGPPPDSRELGQARRTVSELRHEVRRLQDELGPVVAERDEVKAAFQRRDAVVKELRASLAERESGLTKREAALEQRKAALDDRDRALEEREKALSQRGTALTKRQTELDGRDRQLTERDQDLTEHDAELEERERTLAGAPGASHPVELRTARFDAPARLSRNPIVFWLQRVFAVVFLVVPIVAVLILAKAL